MSYKTLEALEAFISTHAAGLKDLDIIGYLEDAVSDAKHILNRREEQEAEDRAYPAERSDFKERAEENGQGWW